jgi:hypothetical protein
VSNVQIEKKEIDHVPLNKAIGKVSQNTGEQERKRHVAQKIGLSLPHEKSQDNKKRDR